MNKGMLRGKGQKDSEWRQLPQVVGQPRSSKWVDQYGNEVDLLTMTW